MPSTARQPAPTTKGKHDRARERCHPLFGMAGSPSYRQDLRHTAACDVSFPHRGRLRRTSALRRDGRVTLFGEGWVTGHRSSCGIGGVDMTHAYLTASLTGVPEVVELGVG